MQYSNVKHKGTEYYAAPDVKEKLIKIYDDIPEPDAMKNPRSKGMSKLMKQIVRMKKFILQS